MINNTVNYYQTPYDIALIVEQLSNYNIMLREQIEMEEDVFTQQNYKISDDSRCESKLSVSANEYVPKRMEKCEGNDDKFNNNAWIKPKKCMPATCLDTESKFKEEHDDEINKINMLKDINNNQYKALLSEDEKEDKKNTM